MLLRNQDSDKKSLKAVLDIETLGPMDRLRALAEVKDALIYHVCRKSRNLEGICVRLLMRARIILK